MSRLDVRTKTVGDIRDVDAEHFFEQELPTLFAERSHLAAEGARQFAIKPLAILTPSGSWTLSQAGDHFTVSAGDTGASAIQLDDTALQDLLNNLYTVEQLFNLKRMKVLRGASELGRCDDAHGWEAVLRCLVEQQPMYTTGSIRMLDRKGDPLDLNRSFTPEDDDAEIAHFLAEAGFLHLSGWLDESLMSEIADDMDAAFAKCTPHDGSWWLELQDGSRRPGRILSFASHSAAFRRLIASERYQRLTQLTDDGYAAIPDAVAIQKPIGVTRGVSDIGWHNDCAAGLHAFKCAALNVGISVTGAGPGSAQLGIIPGSHRALMPTHRSYPHVDLQPKLLSTRTGDMTVHTTCLMHMAVAPTVYERKVLYASLELPHEHGLDAIVAEVMSKITEAATNSQQEAVPAM